MDISSWRIARSEEVYSEHLKDKGMISDSCNIIDRSSTIEVAPMVYQEF